MAVNATAPEILARWAADNGALLIHYSTDYVFDGTKADPYQEEDVVNPQSVYDESKRRGEEAVRASACSLLFFARELDPRNFLPISTSS
ncbi:dTDP-4-dehydrorhamnose reductase [Rhizobium sp. BK312]|nr:dTDP-4-dehydrorhamnose reductase [Rhizobium sp. BK312]